MRKTIKVKKYPFPTGWEPAATYVIEGGDQKEVTYLLFVIFFPQTKFLENEIYTEIYTVNCQFTQ